MNCEIFLGWLSYLLEKSIMKSITGIINILEHTNKTFNDKKEIIISKTQAFVYFFILWCWDYQYGMCSELLISVQLHYQKQYDQQHFSHHDSFLCKIFFFGKKYCFKVSIILKIWAVYLAPKSRAGIKSLSSECFAFL